MTPVRLGAIQYRAPKGRSEEARRDLVGWLEEAGVAGVQLAVCPEMATTGYVWSDAAELLPHAEAARGPTLAAVSEVARRYGMWVVVGLPEVGSDGLYNSALVVDHTGRLLTCYRKVLLFPLDRAWARPGRERCLADTPFGWMAPGICMDLNDDGFTRFLRTTRPRVVAFPTNWVHEGEDEGAPESVHRYWARRLTGWSGWFVAANTWGVDQGVRFAGRSAVLGPGGVVLGALDEEGDGLLVVDAASLPAGDA